jgi:hypothetical protein
LFGKKMKDPVRGTAQVVSSSLPPHATHGRCKMHLVVQADGLDATAVEHGAWIVPTDRWPYPGEVLPVTVDRLNPERIDIDWDEVPKAGEQSAAQAEALAAQLRGETTPAVDSATGGLVDQLQQMFPGAHIEVQGGTAADLPPGTLSQLEQALGMDLDADGHVRTASPAASGGEPGKDRIAQLERVAALHKAGALTDEEFAAEKRRILAG